MISEGMLECEPNSMNTCVYCVMLISTITKQSLINGLLDGGDNTRDACKATFEVSWYAYHLFFDLLLFLSYNTLKNV